MTNIVEKRELEKVLQEKYPDLKISVSGKTVYYDAYAPEALVIELQAFLNLIKIDGVKLERRVF